MAKETHQDEPNFSQTEALAWRMIMCGLAGSLPTDDDDESQANYRLREEMKRHASAMRTLLRTRPASDRAPYWLMHAYSHYWRALSAVDRLWDSASVDREFPEGLTFSVYLSAWLWAVAMGRLGITSEELDAIEEATGCLPKAHALLPKGCSEFNQPSAA